MGVAGVAEPTRSDTGEDAVVVSSLATIAYFTILFSVGFGIGIARFAMDNPKCLRSISGIEIV